MTLECTLELPSILHDESTVREWLDDPRGRDVFAPVYRHMRQLMNSTFGTDGEEDDLIGMSMDNFIMDMPLLSMLQFQEKSWEKPAREIVNDLLQQVHN